MDEISIMFTTESWYVLLPLFIGVLIGFIFWINKRIVEMIRKLLN